jgi:cobalt/nickel transport system permease protein
LDEDSMHIPDGYLSPATCVAMYGAAAPFWVIAVRRVRKTLNDRTVPVLAIFAALAFAIMMFNIPVPGGTTAHGVGGTLMAIVLGPWAAIIGVSTALVLQALFFGDGGITAIGANCFNMAIVLPLVGYGVYLLISRNSGLLSQRRVVAAAVGGWAGITAAALCAGIELGIQPIFWSAGGHALYSPYTLSQAIPAMVLAHAFGASFVEAAITALGVAYLQRSRPDLLQLGLASGDQAGVEAGQEPAGSPMSLWAVAGGLAAVCLPVLFLAGLILGKGHVAYLFGVDWSQVDLRDVGKLLLYILILNAVLLPLAYFASPKRWRALVTWMVGIALWAPIGLITPGIAFAEYVPAQGDKQIPGVSYIPSRLASLSGHYHPLLPAYNFPWINGSDPISTQALGYTISGFVGMAILIGLGLLLYVFIRSRSSKGGPTDDWRTAS